MQIFSMNKFMWETNGEIVGQINGLSVIEYPGTPVCFGEPSRISCLSAVW